MEAVAREYASDYDFLITFVRADYDGAMIRAIRDNGWLFFTAASPSQAGNRDDRQIRQEYKWQFVCSLPEAGQQTDLTDWLY